MNFEAYLTKTIERVVRTAVQEELKDFKEEILNCITTRPKTRNVTSYKNKPKSRIIRPKELAFMLSVSTVTVWRMEKRGDLPPRVKVSNRAVGWLRSDIEEWLIHNKQDE